MKAARIVALLAVAVLGLTLLTTVALAGGKKKKTGVIYFAGNPKINSGGKVTARGSLNTASACKVSRGMRLQALDQTGTVFSTLDGSTSDSNGNWSLSGQLPKSLPAGTNSVRVKATKRTAGKFVCKAGTSAPVVIPAK
jgi:hypothetical protein